MSNYYDIYKIENYIKTFINTSNTLTDPAQYVLNTFRYFIHSHNSYDGITTMPNDLIEYLGCIDDSLLDKFIKQFKPIIPEVQKTIYIKKKNGYTKILKSFNIAKKQLKIIDLINKNRSIYNYHNPIC